MSEDKYTPLGEFLDVMEPRAIKKLLEIIDEQQAKIDSLMLEYCPDEMTEEQLENWEKHQKPVSPQVFT